VGKWEVRHTVVERIIPKVERVDKEVAHLQAFLFTVGDRRIVIHIEAPIRSNCFDKIMVKLERFFLNVFISFVAVFLVISCDNRANNSRDVVAETVHNFQGIFGESYLATGIFQRQQGEDSIENNHWLFTNLTKPFVMYGDYSNGFPAGKWNFGFKDSSLISSTWSIYKNELTNCSFS
jgi:hypothetical protein